MANRTGLEELLGPFFSYFAGGPKKPGAYPGHGTHVHIADNNPYVLLALLKWGQRHGLHFGENPYVGDPPSPGVHADHSYHYRYFPGLFQGRKLGEAFDVTGSRGQMRGFERYAYRTFGHPFGQGYAKGLYEGRGRGSGRPGPRPVSSMPVMPLQAALPAFTPPTPQQTLASLNASAMAPYTPQQPMSATRSRLSSELGALRNRLLLGL